MKPLRERFGWISLLAGLMVFIAALAYSAPPAAAQFQCFDADWRIFGYRDGSRGLRDSYYLRASRCELPVPRIERQIYLIGYREGLDYYCTPENGYRMGRRNLDYYGVCPSYLELAFLAAYRRGLTAWSVYYGYDGYWYSGAYILHLLLPRGPRRHHHLRRAPRSHRQQWHDRDRDWKRHWDRRQSREIERERDRDRLPRIVPKSTPAPRKDAPAIREEGRRLQTPRSTDRIERERQRERELRRERRDGPRVAPEPQPRRRIEEQHRQEERRRDPDAARKRERETERERRREPDAQAQPDGPGRRDWGSRGGRRDKDDPLRRRILREDR